MGCSRRRLLYSQCSATAQVCPVDNFVLKGHFRGSSDSAGLISYYDVSHDHDDSNSRNDSKSYPDVIGLFFHAMKSRHLDVQSLKMQWQAS
jgi:hypothetical protein